MIPIRRRLYQSLAGFTPRQLFAALQGAWLEPVQGSIWQENTGVIPTVTSGQTLGLVLDQSQGAALGPELIANGDGTTLTGWTTQLGSGSSITPVGGEFYFVSTGGISILRQSILTAGRYYRISFSYRVISGSAKYSAGGIVEYNFTGTGTISVTLRADAEQFYINRTSAGQPAEFYIDNISVREILGNHASQSVSGNRPTYQLDSKGLPLARHDATDSLVVSLPNLGGGIYSASGSVYFATPVGMSALHNQSMGTSFTLPALSSDIYSWIVVPQRLSTVLEGRLDRYMLRKAGLSVPDYLTDDFGETITDDIGDPILAG